jgi:hypothetical protein
MKTNLNFYEQTILENINLEGYNLPDNLNTFEKVANVYSIFKSEYVHENNKHLHVEKLFCEWLQGLPNCLSVPYMNYEILENAKNYGIIINNETNKDRYINTYWINLSKSFFELSTNL